MTCGAYLDGSIGQALDRHLIVRRRIDRKVIDRFGVGRIDDPHASAWIQATRLRGEVMCQFAGELPGMQFGEIDQIAVPDVEEEPGGLVVERPAERVTGRR